MNKAMLLWRGLAPRERVLIAGGTLLLVMVLTVVLGVQPLLEQSSAARERLDRALEDSVWLQTRMGGGELPGLSCPQYSGDNSVDALAAQHGISLQAGSDSASGEMRLALSAAGGNALLNFLLALECQGYRLHSFALDSFPLDSSDPQGSVSGKALLTAPVTPRL